MELSILLAKQICSMMLIVLIGFIVVKAGVIKKEDSRVLSVLTLYVIGPCMTLSAFQLPYSPDKMKGLLFALFAAIAVHVIFIVVTRLASKVLPITTIENVSLIYTNCGNLIIPLAYATLGKESVFYACAYIMVQTILFWTHAASKISGTLQLQWKKICFNPNIIAIALSLILFFGQISLPYVLQVTVDRIGDMVGPISMLIIGILMASMDLKTAFSDVRAYFYCIGRLILYPLMMIGLFVCSPIPTIYPESQSLFLITLLAASAPAASSVTQGAELFHADSKEASVLNVLSVLLCMFTMPLMIAVYQWVI